MHPTRKNQNNGKEFIGSEDSELNTLFSTPHIEYYTGLRHFREKRYCQLSHLVFNDTLIMLIFSISVFSCCNDYGSVIGHEYLML